MSTTPSVMLFSPVRLDHETLALSLASHRALKGIECRVYFDDNTDLFSTRLLNAEDAIVSNILPNLCSANSDEEYRVGNTHVWSKERISRITKIRNAAVRTFLASGMDYLFIVDSDLILHPQTVEHLVSLNLPVVSPVFWTMWQKDGVYAPQTWDVHPYGHTSAKSVLQLRDAGVYKVGGLGAATLIHRDVFARGVDYSPIPALDFEGEDRFFSVRCETNGFALHASSHFPPFHVYRKEQLDEASIWFEQGCDPDYFKNAWLDEQWEKLITGIATPKSTKRKSIALCIPGEQFSASWVMGIINALPAMNREMDLQVVNVFSSNPSVTRQTITRTLLQNEHVFDYVLWVDDDNVLSEQHVKLLIEVLETYPTIDLVAGWCDITRGQYDFGDNKVSCGTFDERGRCVQFTHEEITEARGLVGIDWTGFPCVMMRGELLRRLGPKCFMPIADESLEWGFFGEDVSFCKRAKDFGAELVADPRICLPHLKLRNSNRQLTEVKGA